VVRRGEQNADEVFLRDTVAFEHGGDERLHALVDLLGGVLVDGGGAPEGADGGRGHDGGAVYGSVRSAVARSGARTSAVVRKRHSPGLRRRSAMGPMRVRTSRTTG